jgi:outer membrane receptor for monomeric catechols
MIRSRRIALAIALTLAAQGAWRTVRAEPLAARQGFAGAAKKSPSDPPEAGSSYYVPNITDSAGNSVPIMLIPGSATVIPRQVIDDQQDITICGALRNVSSVTCR